MASRQIESEGQRLKAFTPPQPPNVAHEFFRRTRGFGMTRRFTENRQRYTEIKKSKDTRENIPEISPLSVKLRNFPPCSSV